MKTILAFILWFLLLHFLIQWTVVDYLFTETEQSFIEETFAVLGEYLVGCSSMIGLAILYKGE